MAPKGGNTKKEAGRAKKAENEVKKQQAAGAEKEKKEAEKWQDGAKSSKAKEDKEAKRLADLARKAENARLLAEEEASARATVKAAPKAGAKKAATSSKAAKPAGPGAIAAGGGLEADDKAKDDPVEPTEEFAASGIDNAIDLLDAVTAKMDKASVGQQAAGIEKHPERRYKAAFEAYKERELPDLRADHPGLRLAQYQELLHKQFQKSPDNPYNQVTVSYDATKEDKVEALKQKRTAVEERLRTLSDRS